MQQSPEEYLLSTFTPAEQAALHMAVTAECRRCGKIFTFHEEAPRAPAGLDVCPVCVAELATEAALVNGAAE